MKKLLLLVGLISLMASSEAKQEAGHQIVTLTIINHTGRTFYLDVPDSEHFDCKFLGYDDLYNCGGDKDGHISLIGQQIPAYGQYVIEAHGLNPDDSRMRITAINHDSGGYYVNFALEDFTGDHDPVTDPGYYGYMSSRSYVFYDPKAAKGNRGYLMISTNDPRQLTSLVETQGFDANSNTYFSATLDIY